MTQETNKSHAAVDAGLRMREVGLDRLSFEDVLAALQQDGIGDLEQLVRRQMDLARKTMAKPDPIPVFSSSAIPAHAPAGECRHRAPGIPVLVDGVLYDPKDIIRFDGTALHFVVPRSDGDQVLRAFSGDDWHRSLLLYVRTRDLLSLFDVQPQDFPGFPVSPGQPGNIPPQPVREPPGDPYPPQPQQQPQPQPQPQPTSSRPPPPAQFFEKAGWKGNSLLLGPRLQWSDLTQVPCPRAEFLYLRGDWSDAISSVIAWFGIVVLCEHINLGGSTLGFASGAAETDLETFGWNNRASSVVNWG